MDVQEWLLCWTAAALAGAAWWLHIDSGSWPRQSTACTSSIVTDGVWLWDFWMPVCVSSADCWICSSLGGCQVPLQQLRYHLSFLAELHQPSHSAWGSSDLSHPSALGSLPFLLCSHGGVGEPDWYPWLPPCVTQSLEQRVIKYTGTRKLLLNEIFLRNCIHQRQTII